MNMNSTWNEVEHRVKRGSTAIRNDQPVALYHKLGRSIAVIITVICQFVSRPNNLNLYGNTSLRYSIIIIIFSCYFSIPFFVYTIPSCCCCCFFFVFCFFVSYQKWKGNKIHGLMICLHKGSK